MYRISKYHIGQQDAENLMKTVSLQRKGLMLVTLTNFDNASAPAIARGSICDVANTLFESAGESILGTAVEGQNYIKLVPTSDDNIAAYYTQDSPTWNAELGGWYGVGDSSNHRFIAGFSFSLSAYTEKFFLRDIDSFNNRKYGNGKFRQLNKIITPAVDANSANIQTAYINNANISIANLEKIFSQNEIEISVSIPKNTYFHIKYPTTIVLSTYTISSDLFIDELYFVTLSGNIILPSHQVISINPGTYMITSNRPESILTFKLCGAFGISSMTLSDIFEAES